MQSSKSASSKRPLDEDENTFDGQTLASKKSKSIVSSDPVDYAEKGWKVYRIKRNKQRLIATFTGEKWQIQCAYCSSGKGLCSLSKFRINKIHPAEEEVEVYGRCSSGQKQNHDVSQITSTLYLPRFQDSDAKLSTFLLSEGWPPPSHLFLTFLLLTLSYYVCRTTKL